MSQRSKPSPAWSDETLPSESPPPSRSRSLGKRLLQVTLGILFLFLVSLYGLVVYYLHDRPELNASTLGSLAATSFIYDYEGGLITALHGEQNRIPVALHEIPPAMKNAIIAAEDVRFYDHQGVDFRAIGRALVTNFQDGRFSQGASTITQQLVKNTFLTNDKTIKRKVQEAFLSFQIESRFSKEQILEMYLNRIYFGNGAYGVQAAAQTYFGKSVSALNLAEAALLASMPRAPSYYSPIANPEATVDRRNAVLTIMAKNGLVSESEMEEAKKTPLPQQLHGFTPNRQFAAFIDHVVFELCNRHGYTEDQVFRGGLKIYTSLQPVVQQRVEEVINDESLYPPGPADQPVQSAMVVVNHHNGEIVAIGGGRNYDGRRSFNRATQLRRQPGSVIKPIMVYAPAMENGFIPEDVVYDGPMDFNGYAPGNYDGKFRGAITIREALAYSINIPAVYLLKTVGTDRGVEISKKVGLPLTDKDRYLSLALGGMTQGVAPLHMAGAYAALANGGVYVEPHAVVRVVDALGKEKIIEPKQDEVLSPVAAYRVTDMLITAVQSGTGYRAQMRRPVAGKTGTTELPPLPEFKNVKGNKDAWFVGYTPEVTCAVWMGYDRTDGQHYLKQVYGGSYPAQMFREVLSTSLHDYPVAAFAQPEGYDAHRTARYVGPKDVDPWVRPGPKREERAEQAPDTSPVPNLVDSSPPGSSVSGGAPPQTPSTSPPSASPSTTPSPSTGPPPATTPAQPAPQRPVPGTSSPDGPAPDSIKAPPLGRADREPLPSDNVPMPHPTDPPEDHWRLFE
ncbi:PBP1A family penicillin-binding protein [Heliobacterium gestii]|uniref:Penicillin-binding protein 1A n=1 Tax=Heliomicrobium gestii TaxID=2699 RepID=A0A845L9S6_HELGE|nr:PBP1A family penicillin-binding protein [Heliomicrobium gestii]MBM7865425.1 1A family penicillin-binding protein [Heliomicrobium gestii]MZP41680.1 PBP1A family penicillin-binding protein [Heliomicrobium gestii]